MKDPAARNRFMQLSEVQKHLEETVGGDQANSTHRNSKASAAASASVGGDNTAGHHDSDPSRSEDAREIAAVLKLFMDMIGISESDASNIPGGMCCGTPS